jgi:SAM-dependent methyltransferase
MFEMTDINRHCPVCSDEAKKVLYRQRFARLSEGSLLKGYDVVVCRNCGFGFADRIPDQNAFDFYYRDMSKYDYQERGGKESTLDEERFEETAALIRRFLPDQKATILDIGCSTGGLLWKIKKSGFLNVIGLDPSPLCASAAMKLYDIRVSNGSISDLSALGQAVDFVILVGVLEHLRDLSAAVEEIGKIITGKGQLYAEVPDVSAFAKVPDAPFQQFSLEHINFFSVQSLANLMMTRGFRQVYSQRLVRRQSQNTAMPVVTAVFQKREEDLGQYIMDTETEKCLVEYIQASAAIDKRICEIIDGIVVSARRIFVWGVGTHTLRLMETSRLSKANIRAFVDSNIHYHEKKLQGIPIISPSQLIGEPDPILISSRVFQQEIERQVRNELKLENELITLYESAS